MSEMPAGKDKLLEALRVGALTAAGLIMAASPLAIWVAWSQTVLVLVLAIGTAAAVLCFALYAETHATDVEQRRDSRFRTMEPLDAEFLTEVSDLGPFVYHNRLSGDSGFRRKMARLKSRLARLAHTTKRAQ